jgi:hypothetical protein
MTPHFFEYYPSRSQFKIKKIITQIILTTGKLGSPIYSKRKHIEEMQHCRYLKPIQCELLLQHGIISR